MRFDLFYEICIPPWQVGGEAAAYQRVLDEITLADELGFGCSWLVEHHFTRHYSHCSKPELLLAAAAQRTHRIRLGLGVIPMPYHHPIHVAERVAALDILSNGRLEVGIGRGFSPTEYGTFAGTMAESRSLVEEALQVLRLSFEDRPINFAGGHYKFEQLDMLPHVVQRPHPPLWGAAVSPQTFAWTARQQLGLLAGPFKPWWMTRHDIRTYLDTWNAASAPRIGMTLGILCLRDARRARRLAKPAMEWFYRELYKTTLPVLEKLYPSYEHFRELGRFRKLMRIGIDFSVLEGMGMVIAGDPAHCVAALQKYRAAGVTHVLCAIGAGAVENAVVLESMRCMAEEVLPAFASTPDIQFLGTPSAAQR
ncbi:MAG: LLM class flavin-dependent oxidoreductase [Burkholderiales bacterium]